jgi:hypothetical protein
MTSRALEPGNRFESGLFARALVRGKLRGHRCKRCSDIIEPKGGDRLGLPRFLRERKFPAGPVAIAIRRFAVPLRWAERLSRPRRLLPLTGRVARVALGGPLLLLALALSLPIPLGNALPAIALTVFAIGFMERDGLAILVALGVSIVALVWTAILILFGAHILDWLWTMTRLNQMF